ncbi:hypothetical protein TVAG_505970 [Trichomonas vaginalis G3]|uniref:Uncharacterized protein n=1 Tax=Trichomonas vaginalis (strain ATCC PRA-98 / G3) TaxID=412133 RepID=A2H224_TRIV3|nr:hypothetical protein TVAGG3_0657190 [Trichomonas vaginalis G3]EAX76543.1 hypothetical protein TVAG_505970 [Trichomonas vaginalis G3]KAI5506248.1 hypothetical protein TVAGG3_0657190 [Trichomonas vaginalis G3]|eukprot:XP_001289473.1 hypothetical protein [Trichomonas vaginalis G3]
MSIIEFIKPKSNNEGRPMRLPLPKYIFAKTLAPTPVFDEIKSANTKSKIIGIDNLNNSGSFGVINKLACSSVLKNFLQKSRRDAKNITKIDNPAPTPPKNKTEIIVDFLSIGIICT